MIFIEKNIFCNIFRKVNVNIYIKNVYVKNLKCKYDEGLFCFVYLLY